jgi:hypothetical protein
MNAVLTVIFCVVFAFACGAGALRVLKFFGWTIGGRRSQVIASYQYSANILDLSTALSALSLFFTPPGMRSSPAFFESASFCWERVTVYLRRRCP